MTAECRLIVHLTDREDLVVASRRIFG